MGENEIHGGADMGGDSGETGSAVTKKGVEKAIDSLEKKQTASVADRIATRLEEDQDKDDDKANVEKVINKLEE